MKKKLPKKTVRVTDWLNELYKDRMILLIQSVIECSNRKRSLSLIWLTELYTFSFEHYNGFKCLWDLCSRVNLMHDNFLYVYIFCRNSKFIFKLRMVTRPQFEKCKHSRMKDLSIFWECLYLGAWGPTGLRVEKMCLMI